MSRKLTAAMLRDAGACRDQLETFKREWPNGCDVTLADVRRAVALGLDIQWAVEYLLDAPAWKAYDRACATARKAYDRALATAFHAAWHMQGAK